MEALSDAVVLGESPHADDGLEPGLQGFRQGPQPASLEMIHEFHQFELHGFRSPFRRTDSDFEKASS